MSGIERPKTGLELLIEMSRGLPQIGGAPDLALRQSTVNKHIGVLEKIAQSSEAPSADQKTTTK